MEFNVSVVLNKSAPYFLSDSHASLINASIAKDGKLSVSCARDSWGQVIVGVSLIQTVKNHDFSSIVSLSDVKVLSIFVSPVNNPPSFGYESDSLIISQQQTAHISGNFIQNISVGPSDEQKDQVISQLHCFSSHRAIKSVVAISQCLNASFCSSASLNFDLVPYSQGLANVTCCVSETPPPWT